MPRKAAASGKVQSEKLLNTSRLKGRRNNLQELPLRKKSQHSEKSIRM